MRGKGQTMAEELQDGKVGDSGEMLDFYQKLRNKIRDQLANRKAGDGDSSPWSRLVDTLWVLPDLFHLGVKLFFDGDVPAARKGALIAAIMYVVSPIDLIPDIIPVAGWVDDLVIMAMGLSSFLDTEDEGIAAAVKRHWAGDESALKTVRHVLDIADSAVDKLPKSFMNIARAMFPKSKE